MSAISVETFSAEARSWLDANAKRRSDSGDTEPEWGVGELDVSVFHNLTADQERRLLGEIRVWNAAKAERGYHAITWPTEYGGLGLSKEHGRAFGKLEAEYEVPPAHETISVTIGLMAPTVNLFGSPEQKEKHIASFLRTNELCCQLFSEPGAGSDLASLSCRADRDGDSWVINGQKVWSSGALFSEWGELIARSDTGAAKHAGMTAFMIPMDLPGMEIRPIKQMSGGSSFNEVFFTDVRVPDSMRLGDVGAGWKVALATLGFERDHSSGGSSSSKVGGSYRQLLATAQALGRDQDPAVRRALVDVYLHSRIEGLVNRRAADLRRAGNAPGPEGSLGKLIWTDGLTRLSAAVSTVLGPLLTADAGIWGTYVWGEHVLGAPGYRIAGGSDEVQRNIIGERVLGLPREPQVTK